MQSAVSGVTISFSMLTAARGLFAYHLPRAWKLLVVFSIQVFNSIINIV